MTWSWSNDYPSEWPFMPSSLQPTSRPLPCRVLRSSSSLGSFDFLLHLATRPDDSPLLQFLHGRACLPRILRLEYFIQFFQADSLQTTLMTTQPLTCIRAYLRLHEEEVDEKELKDVPKHEEYIEPISDLVPVSACPGIRQLLAEYSRSSRP
jgi:hypothetical protein